MNLDRENMSLKSLLHNYNNNDQQIATLNEDQWRVSFVGNKQKSCAFLLIEGVEYGQRVSKIVQLSPAHISQRCKARVNFHNIHVSELNELGTGCRFFSYELDNDQRVALLDFIDSQVILGNKSLINYVPDGDSELPDILIGSLQSMKSNQSVDASKVCLESSYQSLADALNGLPENSIAKLLQQAKLFSVDSILKLVTRGHNAYSWAEAILKTLHIQGGMMHEFKLNEEIMQEEGLGQSSGCVLL